MNCTSNFKLARDAAVAKCRTCRFGEYRPYRASGAGRNIACQQEAIRCIEGWFGLAPSERHRWGVGGWRWATETFWAATGPLARADSKVTPVILNCDWWEKRRGG